MPLYFSVPGQKRGGGVLQPTFGCFHYHFCIWLGPRLEISRLFYRFFDNIFHTVCKKKTGHLLLGLSSKVFTFDHLFSYRSDFFNNLTISLTKWTEYRKNRCLISSTNSVRLHFRQRVEKTKENAPKTKLENLQNGQEKYGGKKFGYGHIWEKN